MFSVPLWRAWCFRLTASTFYSCSRRNSSATRESNTISIWNNGKGIPVVEHKDEKMYVPALIFGHLLTSSNYDDDEKKVTGERRHLCVLKGGCWRPSGTVNISNCGPSVWPQVEGTATAPNSATSSAPSSQWKPPARSTDTVSSRCGCLWCALIAL